MPLEAEDPARVHTVLPPSHAGDFTLAQQGCGEGRGHPGEHFPQPTGQHPPAPVSPLSSHAGDGRPPKPQLPQEESGEEPGVNRHFSLNGIDYFCNQHLKLNIHYYRIPKQK